MNTSQEFRIFYHNQNAISVKKLISKSIYFLNNTSPERHPRKYFKNFTPLPKVSYPIFKDYANIHTIRGTSPSKSYFEQDDDDDDTLSKRPLTSKKIHTMKTLSSFDSTKCYKITESESFSDKCKGDCCKIIYTSPTKQFFESEDERENIETVSIAGELSTVQQQIDQLLEEQKSREEERKLKLEENKRIQELEEIYQQQLEEEKKHANQKRIMLSKLKTKLFELQAESIEKSRVDIENRNLEERKRHLHKIQKQIDSVHKQDELELQQTEEELSKHYVELLKHKQSLEHLMYNNENGQIVNRRTKLIQQQREILNKELEKMRNNISEARLKIKTNVPAQISIINNKAECLDFHIAEEIANEQNQFCACKNSVKILEKERDVTKLNKEIETLLQEYIEQTDNQLGNLKRNVLPSDTEKLLINEVEQQIVSLIKEKNNIREENLYS